MTDQELRMECVKLTADAADRSDQVMRLAGEIYAFVTVTVRDGSAAEASALPCEGEVFIPWSSENEMEPTSHLSGRN